MPNNSGIQALLYCNFIIKSKYRVDAVSEKMGVAPDTLYKWIEGVNLFPADRIAALTVATGDAEYLEYIAGKAGLALVPKIKDKRTAEVLALIAKIFNQSTVSTDVVKEGE